MRVVKKVSLFILIFMCLCAFKCISSDLEAVNLNEKIIYFEENAPDMYITSINPDGSEKKRLTASFGAVSPAGICTSRDGRKIYYVVETPPYTVCSVNSDGSNLTGIRNIAGTTMTSYLSLSPDGKKLIVSNYVSTSDPAVIINTDGSGGETLLSGYSHVTYSPLGDKIAYVRRYSVSDYRLCVSDPEGTNEKVLLSNTTIALDIRGISWHPDGSKILYNDYNNFRLMEINVDGSGSRCVLFLSGGELVHTAVYSPDGYKIVAHMTDTFEYLYVMNIDGTNFRQLSGSGLLITTARPCFLGYSH